MKQTIARIIDKAFPKDPNFDRILEVTLSFEGGYTKRDEPTYKGITQRLYNAYADQHGLELKDVRKLTDREIWEIYYNEFYLRPKLFILPYEIQGLVFDFGVNSGTGTAVKKLQGMIGTKVDNDIGDNTKKAAVKYLDKYGMNSFVINYNKQRKAWMQQAIVSDPSKKENWNGWINRLNKLKEVYGV